MAIALQLNIFCCKGSSSRPFFVLFPTAWTLNQVCNCNSFVQSHERVSVKEQANSIQSTKGPVIFLSGKIHSQTRLNIQLTLNFGCAEHHNKVKSLGKLYSSHSPPATPDFLSVSNRR